MKTKSEELIHSNVKNRNISVDKTEFGVLSYVLTLGCEPLMSPLQVHPFPNPLILISVINNNNKPLLSDTVCHALHVFPACCVLTAHNSRVS